MHHLKPSSKGDPLCPLGFHPQVRWPTRCKRCFRDYKEHGNKKEPPQLRKDDFAFSTPTLSSASPFSRSRTEDVLQDSSLGSRTWTSSSNLSTLGSSSSTQLSDQFKERGSSWTSSPNLAESQSNEDVTVNITLPRRRRPVAPQHQSSQVDERKTERRRDNDYSSSRTDSSTRDYSSSRTDSLRDYSSSRTDSSRDYGSSRTDSSRDYSSSRTDSSRDYGSSRTDSLRDYGSSRTDSLRDYGSSRTDSLRDYGSSRTDSSRDYGSSRVDSSRDYSSSRTDSSTRDYGSSRSDSSAQDRGLSRTGLRDRRIDSRTENLLNSSANKPEVDFMFHVKSLSGKKSGEANRSSSRRGSSSSDDAPTVTTDTTLVNMRENQLLEEIESLKKEVDVIRTRCEKAEREKSDLMLRRLASLETTSTKSESLKLQQKVNELKSQVEDLRDEKKSLTLKVREVETELDCIKATGAQKEAEQLRTKMDKAEQLIEQLMEENQDMRRDIRDMEEEMLEMQDTFREDQADEYSSLKKELEQATKKCRILTFKLKKSERKTEQLDAEKLEMERKIREIAGGQAGLDKAERIRQLEHELKVANEAALRLQKDLEDAQSKIKEGTQIPSKKKTPMLGSIPKTPSGEKVSRASLIRGGSQEDPAQILRDLQDSLEREADLREQLKHAEEEVEIFRKKASRVEEDNESLVLQLKKMATKARSRRLSPTANRLNPEEKDEGISDEDDPADLRIQLELNEQEACVLRRKVEELESERDAINRKNKDLQEKLTAKLSTVAKQQALHSGDSNTVYQHKIKVMEAETSELRLKLIEKERECERLHAEISLSNKKPKLLQKSKSLDGDQATVDLRRQLQVIESEAAILRTKIQDLESDNDKLLVENKRLIMLKGARRAGSVEKSDEPKPLVVATLEKQLDDANKKIKELQAEKEQNKDKTAEPPPPANTEELDKAKLQLKKAETAKKKLEESLERISRESSLNTLEFFNKRKPKQPTLQTTKQQLKKWVDESENDISELLISLKKAQQEKPAIPNGSLDKTAIANAELEKKKLETELKELKEQSTKKDKQLEDVKSQIKTLEQDKTKSKKETDSSKVLWDKEKLKLTTTKEELEKKKTQLEKQVTDLQTEIKDLKKSTEEITSLKKKIDTLNKSLDDEKKQSEEIKKKVKNSEVAEDEKARLLKEIEEKDSKATALEKSIKELEEKAKKSEKLLATRKDKLTKMEKEKTEKEKKLEEAEKTNETLTGEKKELASKVEEHESKIKQLKSELDRKKKAIEELEKTSGPDKGVSPNSDELRRLRDELEAKQTNIEEVENKLKKAIKEKDDSHLKLDVKEKELKKELEQWEKRASDLENDLQVANEETAAERKMLERLKATQALEIKAKEQEIAQLQTKNLTSGTKKLNDVKQEMQAKIDRLEMALESEKREYEDLTGKYEELEEEHVVMKAQLVKEKETVQNQLMSTEEELKDSSSELRTMRDTLNNKKEVWAKEKVKLQEKLQDAEKKAETHNLESQKLDAVSQGKQMEIDQFKKEINDLIDQNDRIRRDNEELRKQMEDFDKVVKVQRSMNADVDALEKEIKEYKTRLVMEEKSRKKELAAQKARYDNRVAVLSNELLGAQGQVARFKKERDSYKKILDETQRQDPTNRLSYDGENAVAQLEQQVGCLEEELSEARLEASRLRTELLSEKSAWQLKQSELTSKLNEMEEEKVLMGGRTKITGVKTRMELAWQKEREEQQRLLQETSTLARDLRQTLFEVERERDRERLEAKRRLEQVKRNSDEEQEDLKKKLHDMQCDILELRDAHAKLRTTNEKLRRERDKWDREREAVRHMMNERKKNEQEDERKIISVAQLVEELTHLAPGLFPSKPRTAGVAPTPPLRRKSKSREASPLLERRDMSRESSVGRDEAKASEMSEILLRLNEAARQLRKHSSDTERARRSMSMRAGSTDSDSGIEPISVKMRGVQRTNSNLRKSFSLEQTQQEQQAIWRPADSDSREGSVQSIDDETYQRIMMSRESGMDSRLSGGSTRSEIVTSSEKKKKSGLFGKLKKLARSRSTDRDSDGGSSDVGSLSQVSDAGSVRLQKKPPTLKKTKKTT